jgi:4-alpha-glucanotransferase
MRCIFAPQKQNNMTVQFQIHYHTRWGQQIAVVGDHAALGKGDPAKALVMEYTGEGRWLLSVPFSRMPALLKYQYLLLQEGEATQEEAGSLREVRLPRAAERVVLRDTWRNPTAVEEAFFSAAFEAAVFRPGHIFKPGVRKDFDGGIPYRFQLRAATVPQEWQIALTGNLPELGAWDTTRPLLLGNAGFPVWSLEVCLPRHVPFEYKYGLFHPAQKRWIAFETGENRHGHFPEADGKPGAVVLSDEYAHFPGPSWKGAGVAIPVFSLRSERGLGIGEFADLRLLTDWAVQTGLKMIQILPINDTTITYTWTDSYPYSAISVFALHPMYLSFDAIPEAEKLIGKQKLQEARLRLNAEKAVDYEEVVRVKQEFSKTVFEGIKKDLLKNPDFLKFVDTHQDWLVPYSVFCYLRDKSGTVDFSQWGKYARYDEVAVKALAAPGAPTYTDIAFFYFQQYYLDAQLAEAAEYARSKGIVLKGDLPIGIYRNSTDAWVAPSLYNMDGQAGAPPDPFSDTGQNWGFPTYNWTEMAKDGYSWWRKRMTHLSRYFDAYRIDHILGFFRIWEIPAQHIEGLMGHFSPAIPITRQELEAMGIGFDPDRFCLPYIVENMLQARFGTAVQWVKDSFLRQNQDQRYSFKPEWSSQRVVSRYFDDPANATHAPFREPLLRLFGEVLFFEVPGSDMQAFHPRIDFSDTDSFKSLPYDVQGKLQWLHHDYFYNRQEAFWKAEALRKLPAIRKATNMLICGEDLGMVPACVPGVMRAMGMLSLEIQRMSKNPSTEFLQPRDIPYLSVTSPSTHDMAPMRAWWEEMEGDQLRRFFHNELGCAGEPPLTCEPYIAEAIVRQHLQWHNMWTVFPLQDLLATDLLLRRDNPSEERINVPAIPQYYWQYRLHLSLGQLLESKSFNEKLKNMLVASGRCTPITN